MARQNYDNNGLSLRQYQNMLRTSIEDLRITLNNLLLLEKLSKHQRISGRSIEAIRMCACYTHTNINLHLLPLGINLYKDISDDI